MRLINFILFGLLFCSGAYASEPSAPAFEKKSILCIKREKHPAFTTGQTTFDTGLDNRSWQLYQIEKKIHSGRAFTITGIAIFGAGVGLTFAGVEFSNIANNASGSTTGVISGAIMSYVIGGSCLVASIPLTAIGAIRWSEGKFEKRMYMSLQGTAGAKGMGMKMTF